MKNLKIILALAWLVSTQLHCMERPPQPVKEVPLALEQFEQLPADVKRLIIPLIVSSNVTEVANTILALNRTNKFFHNFINTPAGVISILERMPYTTNAIDLVELLKKTNFTVIKNKIITKWLAAAKKSLKGGRDLHAAIMNSDLQEVNELLKNKNIDLNRRDKTDNTVLDFILCLRLFLGQIEMFKALLNAGAVPNERGRILARAIDTGQLEMAKLLVKSGAKMRNIPNKLGMTDLMLASLVGDTDAVKKLLVAGANVNMRDTSGESALIKAAREGDTEIVAILLKAGAKPDFENYSRMSALDFAERKGCQDIVKMLKEVLAIQHEGFISSVLQEELEEVTPLLPPSKKPRVGE